MRVAAAQEGHRGADARSCQTLSRDTTDRDVIVAALAAIPGGSGQSRGRRIHGVARRASTATSCPSLRGLAADVDFAQQVHSRRSSTRSSPTCTPSARSSSIASWRRSPRPRTTRIGKTLVSRPQQRQAAAELCASTASRSASSTSARPCTRKPSSSTPCSNADYEQQRTKLDEAAKNLPAGDIRRGQAVFNSTKTSCIACHTIGYVGGKHGPDLTRIGGIRTDAICSSRSSSRAPASSAATNRSS